jgi:predicted nuclease with TOPRIM domain
MKNFRGLKKCINHKMYDYQQEAERANAQLNKLSTEFLELKEKYRLVSDSQRSLSKFQRLQHDLQTRINELEKLIASDSVYQLLRLGVKSPSHIDAEDSDNVDLYNLSSELRKAKK